MSKTPYDQDNADFSDKAHESAQKQIYPKVFKVPFENLSFETTSLETSPRNEIMDGEMAIDRIVKVKIKCFRQALQFTIQERFRRPEHLKWKDITITEWNNNSNLPSELYKISSGLFVYGYYDLNTDNFIDVIVISVPTLLYNFVTDNLKYDKRKNKKNQDFIGIKFNDLDKSGCTLFWKSKDLNEGLFKLDNYSISI